VKVKIFKLDKLGLNNAYNVWRWKQALSAISNLKSGQNLKSTPSNKKPPTHFINSTDSSTTNYFSTTRPNNSFIPTVNNVINTARPITIIGIHQLILTSGFYHSPIIYPTKFQNSQTSFLGNGMKTRTSKNVHIYQTQQDFAFPRKVIFPGGELASGPEQFERPNQGQLFFPGPS
jgi:hypothetical protein